MISTFRISDRMDTARGRGYFIIVAAVAIVIIYSLSSGRLDTTHPAHNLKFLKSDVVKTTCDHGHGCLESAENATLGFQKIIVINMPSRSDRRDAMALSAAVTGLDIEFDNGVTIDVEPRVVPKYTGMEAPPAGLLKAWRAHLNVLRTMVEQNVQSALIMEDDTDWDIRVKSQMTRLAKASRLLIQPMDGSSNKTHDPTSWDESTSEVPRDLYIDSSDKVVEPTTSPYGDVDKWDLMWIGHCGARMPLGSDEAPKLPLGRAIIPNDETVAAREHFAKMFGGEVLVDKYPEHTRVVTRSKENVCTSAYAVTNQGARRILYSMGLDDFGGAYDLTLAAMCARGRRYNLKNCLTIQPPLMSFHQPIVAKAALSDIATDDNNNKVEYTDQRFTLNMRWSTRMNLNKLIEGETDYFDFHPDADM